jgi:hypothetical protein
VALPNLPHVVCRAALAHIIKGQGRDWTDLFE